MNTNSSTENIENPESQDTGLNLPTWLKDQNTNETFDNLIEKGGSDNVEDHDSIRNDPSGSGWQKEVSGIVTGSTKPIVLKEYKWESDFTHNGNPDDKALPEWLDLVIETEEEKDTTQIKLNPVIYKENPLKGLRSDPLNSIADEQSLEEGNPNSTSLSRESEITPETQPFFMNIIEENHLERKQGLKNPKIEILKNLLAQGDLEQIPVLGQEIIKDKSSIEELSDLLVLWLTDNQGSIRIWHLLGDAYMHLNEPSKALKAYSKASQLLAQ